MMITTTQMRNLIEQFGTELSAKQIDHLLDIVDDEVAVVDARKSYPRDYASQWSHWCQGARDTAIQQLFDTIFSKGFKALSQKLTLNQRYDHHYKSVNDAYVEHLRDFYPASAIPHVSDGLEEFKVQLYREYLNE